MNRIPFSLYDFFGYLAAGFLLMVSLDYIFQSSLLLKEHFSAVEVILLILVSYIMGHLIATPSYWLLEENIAGKILKPPYVNTFIQEHPKLLRIIFPGYYVSIPENICEKIKKKAREYEIEGEGIEFFLLVYYKTKLHSETLDRLNVNLKLYGFSRNISFTCLIISITCLVAYLLKNNPNNLYLFIASLAISIGMFYRFLKFYRLYTKELFLSFLSLPDDRTKNGN